MQGFEHVSKVGPSRKQSSDGEKLVPESKERGKKSEGPNKFNAFD